MDKHLVERKGYWLLGVVVFWITLILHGCQTASGNLKEALHRQQQQWIDSMMLVVDDALIPAIETGKTTLATDAFLTLRRLYKQGEAGFEYFMPGTAKALNGAPIPEVEFEGDAEIEPSGLQVLEELLWPTLDSANSTEALRMARYTRAALVRAEQIWQSQMPDEQQWLQAALMEWVRIAAMGITGFDTPGTGKAIEEAYTTTAAVRSLLEQVSGKWPVEKRQLLSQMEATEKYLLAHPDFDDFDRATFIRDYWQPCFALLNAAGKEGRQESAINREATQLFGKNFLNLAYYLPDSVKHMEGLADLGKQLFEDAKLSSNGRFSCATCHRPDLYFNDQQALSANIHGNELPRNTPSLMNVGYQSHFFWDMRTTSLEMQARDVINSQVEMHGSLEQVCNKLSKDAAYATAFETTFGRAKTIEPLQVMLALAAYQRTLVGFDSPFDAYMTGETDTIAPQVLQGFNLFMGKAKCGTCHFAPTFSGLVPPYFDKMESEVLGTPTTAANNKLDADKGRGGPFPAASYQHAFKTPTVRNAAMTFPYMHNGVYRSLGQVVDFYNKGGGEGLGYHVANQTLPPEPLNLSKQEQEALVAFMESLTDTPRR